jgi:hypothetical protein
LTLPLTKNNRAQLQSQLNSHFRRYCQLECACTLLIGFVTLSAFFGGLFLARTYDFPHADAILVVATIIAFAASLVISSLCKVKLADKYGTNCLACSGSLVAIPTSKAESALIDYPGWNPNDTVPLRCPHCGTFIENYVNETLAKTLLIDRTTQLQALRGSLARLHQALAQRDDFASLHRFAEVCLNDIDGFLESGFTQADLNNLSTDVCNRFAPKAFEHSSAFSYDLCQYYEHLYNQAYELRVVGRY